MLIVCPNLTIKERLQVLRPENPDNYYAEFDLVPRALRPLLQRGKVLVTNWHLFAPESEHVEGGKIVHGGQQRARKPRSLRPPRPGRPLRPRRPILVLNDEGHHAWRPRQTERLQVLETSKGTLRHPGRGRGGHRLDQRPGHDQPAVGVRCCVDLSATPFYLGGTGYIEGSPFPWLVSDFGLVDAIESGIVKIPRLPVSDTTGRPEPKYFRLWQSITEGLQPGERLPGRARKPKPDVVYREAEPALLTLAGQWVERFRYIEEATDEKDKTPPALIIVCDNTDIAEVFYRNISGEQQVEVVEVVRLRTEDETEAEAPSKRKAKTKTRTVYGPSRVFPEFANREGFTPTIRIDSKLLAQAESGDPNVTRNDAAEHLRRIVATVGVKGEPGEQVRCVVSVAMLNEGWDAHNVTHVLGLRAFGSQLLCEQVVGRGLRRMDYTVDPQTGMLTEEYVDIYGVPFSLIPFKGRETKAPAPVDRPKNHVARAGPNARAYEIRFPVVEGYAFALRRNVITADIAKMEPLRLEPEYEPTAVFVKPRVGYEIGATSLAGPGEFQQQDRQAYYASTHLQTIEFEIARQVVFALVGDQDHAPDPKSNPQLRLQSRHQLFPQVLRLVHAYIDRKVDCRGGDSRELGQEKYFQRVAGRMIAAIRPDDGQGEPPLMPILNRYKSTGTTAEVDFKTTRLCTGTQRSHINLVAADTATWEQSAAFRLEQAALAGTVKHYARNDGLGFVIPYEYMGVSHHYEPDFLVKLANDVTLVLEIKGMFTDQDNAKHEAAKRWIAAVNNWGQLGRWAFHVNKDPQMLGVDLRHLVGSGFAMPHQEEAN